MGRPARRRLRITTASLVLAAIASGIAEHITYPAAVAAGDTLVARASEAQRSRRIGVDRIDVVREEVDGEETAVSSFTGTVYVKG